MARVPGNGVSGRKGLFVAAVILSAAAYYSFGSGVSQTDHQRNAQAVTTPASLDSTSSLATHDETKVVNQRSLTGPAQSASKEVARGPATASMLLPSRHNSRMAARAPFKKGQASPALKLNEKVGTNAFHQEVLAAAFNALRQNGALPSDATLANFKAGDVNTMSGDYTLPQTYVNYDQVANGYPVEGAGIHTTILHTKSGPVLANTASRYADVPAENPELKISRDQALRIAVQELNLSEPLPIQWKNNLTYRFIAGQYRRVYDFQFEGVETAVSVDSTSGQTWKETRIHSARRSRSPRQGANKAIAAGQGYLNFEGDGTPLSALKLPYLEIKDTAGKSYFTDDKGEVTFAQTPAALSAGLSGRYAAVSTRQGKALSARGQVSADGILLAFNAAPAELATAQVNGYFHANVVHEYVKAHKLSSPQIDRAVRVNVNLTDSCNAYYSSGAINFYASDSECVNTAYDSVIYHEYGHLVDDAFGGIEDGGLSEGWGDVLSIFITQSPIIGQGFMKTKDSFVRRADNDYVFDENDEVHQQGQAWVGFVWELRQELIQRFGKDKGQKMAEDFVLPSFLSNSFDIPGSVKESYVRSDDDGNIANGTPYKDAFLAAAHKHGLDASISNH